MKLDGRVALVTGTGPNIGGVIATTLAREGAKVACNDISSEATEAVSESIRASGGEALSLPADITDEDAVEHAVATVVETFGRIDILVNNAAITMPHGLLQTTLDEWMRIINTNLTGAFLMSRAAARRMVEQGEGGSIVNVASTSGHRGRADAVAYCASKGGVLNLTRAMAMDLAPHGIRVNSISPTKTGVSVGAFETAEDRFAPEIPLGRLGEPIDQARAVLFLASPDSAFSTGCDIRVDGGALATWGLQPQAIARLGLG